MVNGPSGENLNAGAWVQNQSIPKTFSATLDAAWIAAHCQYAVLVYRDSTSALYYSEITQAFKGNVVGTTGVSPAGGQIPEVFGLSQNYPNPFNPSTTIAYELPIRSHVTLKVFDLLGCEVATLVDGPEEPGYKSLQFDASDLVSGVYFYRIVAGGFVSTRRMLLLK
jgi:hypothetical protein